MRRDIPTGGFAAVDVGNPYKLPMAVMLICPKCDGETELRGAIDAYYLTWCPACERLWRLEIWSLLNTEDPELKLPSFNREKRGV